MAHAAHIHSALKQIAEIRRGLNADSPTDLLTDEALERLASEIESDPMNVSKLHPSDLWNDQKAIATAVAFGIAHASYCRQRAADNRARAIARVNFEANDLFAQNATMASRVPALAQIKTRIHRLETNRANLAKARAAKKSKDLDRQLAREFASLTQKGAL